MERMNGSTIDLDKEIEFIELGEAAQGTIEAGDDQQERLQEFTERVGRGEFHTQIDWDHELKMLIARCVDGRSMDPAFLAPNAAGGSESLFVADDLTTKRYAAEDGTTASGYDNLLSALAAKEYAAGGHTDSHAHGELSGCGANDKLPMIYKYIAENGDILRGFAEKLGLNVPDTVHEHITDNAASRTQFSAGSELLSILRDKADEQLVDELEGGHNEVIAVINKRSGTTLDRAALAAEFGPNYQAFNVDVWAFEEAAKVTSLDDDEGEYGEINQKIVAMAYYNLATTLVLAGKKMRVVVLE
jgi:hypothetical protein